MPTLAFFLSMGIITLAGAIAIWIVLYRSFRRH